MNANGRLLLCSTLLIVITLGGAAAFAGLYHSRQTEPSSPWYIGENIQYFPAGPEFKLSREAAVMKAYKADLEAQQVGQ
jgi:hypothetical protein